MHSFIHTFIHSRIHSFMHSFIHAFIHLFMHMCIHSLFGIPFFRRCCSVDISSATDVMPGSYETINSLQPVPFVGGPQFYQSILLVFDSERGRKSLETVQLFYQFYHYFFLISVLLWLPKEEASSSFTSKKR